MPIWAEFSSTPEPISLMSDWETKIAAIISMILKKENVTSLQVHLLDVSFNECSRKQEKKPLS
jgi:hypothetical protein